MMMKQFTDRPLISVVIPTYNRNELIRETINSVLAQTYTNIEIIIVDDCSTDNTKAVINNIGDPRIRYICHATNLGGAAARNTGIDAAKGEYIAFLDSDDAWVHNKLEIQIAHIQQFRDPQKIVSYTRLFHSLSGITKDTYNAFDEKFFLPKRKKHSKETVSDYLFCHDGIVQTSTLMLHRSLAASTRFQDSLRKHQDWDFCLRLEAAGATFCFIEKPLTIWNGDSSFEHIGRVVNYPLTESFIYNNRAYCTPKAISAFLLKNIIPFLIKSNNRKLYCQKIITIALLQKLISVREFKLMSLQLWNKYISILYKIKNQIIKTRFV